MEVELTINLPSGKDAVELSRGGGIRATIPAFVYRDRDNTEAFLVGEHARAMGADAWDLTAGQPNDTDASVVAWQVFLFWCLNEARLEARRERHPLPTKVDLVGCNNLPSAAAAKCDVNVFYSALGPLIPVEIGGDKGGPVICQSDAPTAIYFGSRVANREKGMCFDVTTEGSATATPPTERKVVSLLHGPLGGGLALWPDALQRCLKEDRVAFVVRVAPDGVIEVGAKAASSGRRLMPADRWIGGDDPIAKEYGMVVLGERVARATHRRRVRNFLARLSINGGAPLEGGTGSDGDAWARFDEQVYDPVYDPADHARILAGFWALNPDREPDAKAVGEVLDDMSQHSPTARIAIVQLRRDLPASEQT